MRISFLSPNTAYLQMKEESKGCRESIKEMVSSWTWKHICRREVGGHLAPIWVSLVTQNNFWKMGMPLWRSLYLMTEEKDTASQVIIGPISMLVPLLSVSGRLKT